MEINEPTAISFTVGIFLLSFFLGALTIYMPTYHNKEPTCDCTQKQVELSALTTELEECNNKPTTIQWECIDGSGAGFQTNDYPPQWGSLTKENCTVTIR